MKLLIAYDGSNYSDSALDDIARAGLPGSGQALVVSVADVWLPPDSDMTDQDPDVSDYRLDPHARHHIEEQWKRGRDMVAEADALANRAKTRLGAVLPGWQTVAVGTYGSPAWEILARADEFKADLILMGSQGRSGVGRFVLGSISQKVVTEAVCSVRIGRGKIEVDDTPVRLIVAFDGSEGAFAAVDAVASRQWPEGSQVRLLAALEELAPSAIGRFIPPVARIVDDVNLTQRTWMDEQAAGALAKLETNGISTDYQAEKGHPKQILVDEAEKWSADCIFLGANRFGSRTERFLLGSTSAAVAARARCSVEVVRKKKPSDQV